MSPSSQTPGELEECPACESGNCNECVGAGCACFEHTCEEAQKGTGVYWIVNLDGSLDGPYEHDPEERWEGEGGSW